MQDRYGTAPASFYIKKKKGIWGEKQKKTKKTKSHIKSNQASLSCYSLPVPTYPARKRDAMAGASVSCRIRTHFARWAYVPIMCRCVCLFVCLFTFSRLPRLYSMQMVENKHVPICGYLILLLATPSPPPPAPHIDTLIT